jgi:predicted N-acyltransferase
MQCVFHDSIHAFNPGDWDSLCTDDYPFARHAFLAALEDSGSLGPDSGWQAHHLGVFQEGRLLLALPLYLKYHSYGEYVFDWSWASAYQQHGLDYYPKLVNAIPFTPCYGPRWLGDWEALDLQPVIDALKEECARLGASGWHCLFPTPNLKTRLETLGASSRLGVQYHWFNHGYRQFDDFLARVNSRKRKMIRKERRQVLEQGFKFDWREGESITGEDWRFFYQLYQLTYAKRSGHLGYLNQGFFQQLGETLPENLLMIRALKDDKPLAAALFLRDASRLYGRYWGSLAEFDFLHFETCYYQGIDYALAHGLSRFDGGAQGEHKLARGFEPVETWSNHWLVHPGFQQGVRAFVREEAASVQDYIAEARAGMSLKPLNDFTDDVAP